MMLKTVYLSYLIWQVIPSMSTLFSSRSCNMPTETAMKQPVLPIPALQWTTTGPPQLILLSVSPSISITLEQQHYKYVIITRVPLCLTKYSCCDIHTHKVHTKDDSISASIIRTIIAVCTMGIVQNTVVWAVTVYNVDIYSNVSEKINASNSIFFVVYAVSMSNLIKQ